MTDAALQATLDAYDETDGGLLFYHPVTDDEIDETYLPWGVVAAGSSADVRFRVRNSGDGYTAENVTVTVADPVDPDAVSAAGQHLVSLDGQIFTRSVEVGDLPPRATSDPVWLRRITGPGQPAGESSFLLTATAGSWAPAVADPNATSSVQAGDLYDPAAAGDDPVADEDAQMGDQP